MSTKPNNLESINKLIEKLTPNESLRLENVPDATYHASTGIGSTALKKFMQSPAHYRAYLTEEFKQTPAQAFGSLVHSLVLEPGTFSDRYAVMPKSITSRRTKAYKAWAAENKGKLELTHDEAQSATHCAESAKNSFARYLVEGAKTEVSYWKKLPSGLVIKARVDLEFNQTCYDLKTTINAEPNKFARDALNYGYHIQAAHYLMVTGLNEFGLLAVEKTPPYACTGPHTFDGPGMDAIMDKVLNAYGDFDASIQADYWPGYGVSEHIIEIRSWNL